MKCYSYQILFILTSVVSVILVQTFRLHGAFISDFLKSEKIKEK